MRIQAFGGVGLAAALAVIGSAACDRNGEKPEAASAASAASAPAPGGASGASAATPMQPASGPRGSMRQNLEARCPMVVEGVQVQSSNTDDGVVLTFTTEDGDVDAL